MLWWQIRSNSWSSPPIHSPHKCHFALCLTSSISPPSAPQFLLSFPPHLPSSTSTRTRTTRGGA